MSSSLPPTESRNILPPSELADRGPRSPDTRSPIERGKIDGTELASVQILQFSCECAGVLVVTAEWEWRRISNLHYAVGPSVREEGEEGDEWGIGGRRNRRGKIAAAA